MDKLGELCQLIVERNELCTKRSRALGRTYYWEDLYKALQNIRKTGNYKKGVEDYNARYHPFKKIPEKYASRNGTKQVKMKLLQKYEDYRQARLELRAFTRENTKRVRKLLKELQLKQGQNMYGASNNRIQGLFKRNGVIPRSRSHYRMRYGNCEDMVYQLESIERLAEQYRITKALEETLLCQE